MDQRTDSAIDESIPSNIIGQLLWKHVAIDEIQPILVIKLVQVVRLLRRINLCELGLL